MSAWALNSDKQLIDVGAINTSVSDKGAFTPSGFITQYTSTLDQVSSLFIDGMPK